MPRTRKTHPRVLVVTPEITWLPPGMGRNANNVVAKAGGMADVTAGLVTALFELGADVHVALPHYRDLFFPSASGLGDRVMHAYQSKMPQTRIHFAEDSIFYYKASVYGSASHENPRAALRFQREVINHVLPKVRPDLIHCHDWMTGLIPAISRRLGIPCLLTMHNIHTNEIPLSDVEDTGIDVREFWSHLYYARLPVDYGDAHANNAVDMLASAVFASHFVNTVSPTFLEEMVLGWHDFVPATVRQEIRNKHGAGCAKGILNAPPADYRPRTDKKLSIVYGPDDHVGGKAANKEALQRELGLHVDPEAPLFFWPSRLDPVQKGCELLAHILYDVVSAYWEVGVQFAVIADGPYQPHFREIVRFHSLWGRVAVRGFNEHLSHLAFAGSDFVLMPSRFEPCGLPQMIGAIYGALPVVHNTGGLHDTVSPLREGEGNGFVFETYDCGGLRWALDQAVAFHRQPAHVRAAETGRVMREATARFNHEVTARMYFDLYEQMLDRPLVT